jgi:hypothetical protein
MPKPATSLPLALALACALGLASTPALASNTLRVGNQVLTTGDSVMRVVELLGKPSRKFRRHPATSRRGRGVRVITDADRGEQWQYRRGNHLTTVTIIDGTVGDIDDRRR